VRRFFQLFAARTEASILDARRFATRVSAQPILEYLEAREAKFILAVEVQEIL